MAKRELGIRYGLILCAIRSMGPESSLAHRRAVRRVQEPRRRRLRPRGQRGQQPGQAPPRTRSSSSSTTTSTAPRTPASRSVRTRSHQAIHKCGAHRIGHGTRLVENGDLLNYVNDHRIPLEVCPSSNLQTRAAASWETHPVDFYVDYGLRVTINTDNRLMSDTTVTQGAPPVPPALRRGRSRRSRRSSSRASRARSCRTARSRISSPRSAASSRPSSSRPRSRSSLCHEHEAGRRQRVPSGVPRSRSSARPCTSSPRSAPRSA